MDRSRPRPTVDPARRQKRSDRDIQESNIRLAIYAVVLLTILLLVFRRTTDFEDDPSDEQQQLQLLYDNPSQYSCRRPKPMVCAHGGDTSIAPPNTKKAFEAALERGVAIEVDVSLTRDDYMVVLHDRDLHQILYGENEQTNINNRKMLIDATKSNELKISGLPWLFLEKLRFAEDAADSTVYKIELLDDVLALAMQYPGAHVTVDVKIHDGMKLKDMQTLANRIKTSLTTAGCGVEQCLVWSKTDAFVEQMKQVEPSIRVGYIVVNDTKQARKSGKNQLLRLQPAEVVGVHYKMASEATTIQAHKNGKSVHVWTANKPHMMRAALDAGADAVVTNHPSRLLHAIELRRQACFKKRRGYKEKLRQKVAGQRASVTE